MATQFSEIMYNLTGFPTYLTEPKYYISVLRYVSSNHMVYFNPHAFFFAGPVTYLSDPEELKVMVCIQEYSIVISPVLSNGKGTYLWVITKKNPQSFCLINGIKIAMHHTTKEYFT